MELVDQGRREIVATVLRLADTIDSGGATDPRVDALQGSLTPALVSWHAEILHDSTPEGELSKAAIRAALNLLSCLRLGISVANAADQLRSIASDFATTDGGKPRLIVHRSHKGDAIELDGTKHPVSSNWADAFDAMIAAGGAGVGLTSIVGKTTRAIAHLPPELQDILSPIPGNKGYVLRLK